MVAVPDIAAAYEVGPAICRALGIDRSLTGNITLHLDVHDVLWVEVQRFVTRAEADAITTILSAYDIELKLKQEGEPQPVAPREGRPWGTDVTTFADDGVVRTAPTPGYRP